MTWRQLLDLGQPQAPEGGGCRHREGHPQSSLTDAGADLGYEPLQIVIKMTRCNGQPVAKISDEPSKTMDYDPSYVKYLREVFQVPELPVPV